MATVTFIKYEKQSASALHGVAAYVSRKGKTMQEDGQRLISGQNCSPQLAAQEFLTTRAAHRKESPVWFYHYVQSFAPDEPVTGELAHEIAKAFAARAWPESEVLIATHIDREHIHSHFIVNSVCFDSGRMLRQGPGTLARLRSISDELCAAHGLSVLPKQEPKTQRLGAREYRSAAKGESWKFRLMNTIDECMRCAHTRDAFIALMKSEGYQVRWEANRKSITYTIPSGMRCRDDRLHDEKYLKEAMEREFRIRAEIISGTAQTAQYTGAASANTAAGSTSHAGGMVGAAGDPQCAVPAHDSAVRSDGGASQKVAQRTDSGAGRGDPAGAANAAGSGATGWEAEREVLFSAQTSPAAPAAAERPSDHLYAAGGGSPASALVGLGRRLEQLQPTEPVMPAHHHTDSKTLRKEREKKIALGHKADDHEDEVSYDWQQTM